MERGNPALYPAWQSYFRAHQPPALVMWGKNDYIFPVEGARPYARDLQTIETHLLDTGHCALEEDGALIAQHMRRFLIKHVRPTNKQRIGLRGGGTSAPRPGPRGEYLMEDDHEDAST